MTKFQIVEEIAKQRKVEEIVHNVCRGISKADAADLSQIIYTALLEKADEIIIRLRQDGEKFLNFYIWGMIRNQYFTNKSRFVRDCRKFQRLSEQIPEEYDGEE